MKLKQLAIDYYNNLYAMPPGEEDLIEFAELVLQTFIEDLEENKTTVAWNYGCDSVIFYNKDYDKKSLKTIEEEYLGNTDDKSNTVEPHGTRVERHNVEDRHDDKIVEQPSFSRNEETQREKANETDSSEEDTRTKDN